MTKEELAKARELCERATLGPWKTREDMDYYQGGTYVCSEYGQDVCRIEDNCSEKFLVESRTLIPRLLDEVERLQKRNEIMREALKSIIQLDGKFGCESVDEAKEALKKESGVV